MKKVSIIIPVYNGSDYLRQAIDSALAQTYKNIEIIVVNDGSIDDGKTEKIAKSYSKKIRYYKKENGGVGSALNFGIKKMKGKYFSWLSHDDLYKKNKIESQIEYINKLNKDIVVYSDFESIDKDSKLIQKRILDHIPPDFFRVELMEKSFLHGCTLLIPKKYIDQLGSFNEKLETTQDYHYWFKLAEVIEFHHISKILVSGRIHGDQGSQILKKIANKEQDNLHNFFINRISNPEIKTYCEFYKVNIYEILSREYCNRGYVKSSFKSLLLSFCFLRYSKFKNLIKNTVLIIGSFVYREVKSIF